MRLVALWTTSKVLLAFWKVPAYCLGEKIIEMICKILVRFVMPKSVSLSR